MTDAIKQVIPNLEFNPERSYLLKGKKILCFKVVSTTPLKLSDQPLFALELPSAELAAQLMEDLYYGEYTGA